MSWSDQASVGKRELGQSIVEVVALAPIVFVAGMIALQALVAGANVAAADNAAHAGALAGNLGHDVREAAERAVPGWSRGRINAIERSGRVTVRLRPRAVLPPLAALLAVEASASFTASGNGPRAGSAGYAR